MQALALPGSRGGPLTTGLELQDGAGGALHPPTHRPTDRGTSGKGGFARGRLCLCRPAPCPPHPPTREKLPLSTDRPRRLTSLHTSIVPNTTCRPSKKLSPMMMTVAPPVVQPSLGLMALMHGVAAHTRQRRRPSVPGGPGSPPPPVALAPPREGRPQRALPPGAGRRAVAAQHADVFKANESMFYKATTEPQTTSERASKKKIANDTSGQIRRLQMIKPRTHGARRFICSAGGGRAESSRRLEGCGGAGGARAWRPPPIPRSGSWAWALPPANFAFGLNFIFSSVTPTVTTLHFPWRGGDQKRAP